MNESDLRSDVHYLGSSEIKTVLKGLILGYENFLVIWF